MNKQELIKKLEELLTTPSELEGLDFDDGYDFGIESAITLAEQLDGPEKPVVPKYVADWIEWCKKNKVTLLGACTAICDNKNIRSLDASGWAMKNQETFAKAWFYGYEIEKEKLYTVELPSPNCPTDYHYILSRLKNGKIIVNRYCIEQWEKFGDCQLTEAEIKKDFEWAWQFAKEVEE